MNIPRIVLGLIALIAGVYGFNTMFQAGEVLKENILLAYALFLGSFAFVGMGLHLLVEPELKEKTQIKLSEQ